MKTMTMNDMANYFEKAYNKLPKCYQADSCLDIWAVDGTLYVAPKEDQESILGIWEAYWDMQLEAWCDSQTLEPVT